ncbi:hypothetical protein MYCTH_2312400 [Thermothelomyces thermophilus ATCC 42464]|uniref:Ubiquitin-like protease family profile domain-containing protein n=1 Tax=Thermothelomyces thermophilus (strain ATCC 42464 / BCRC 31852 / DSM 1799) TaxID=573729 RepID=G2QQE9_THET4|nr:uncharacterized protein MYCTH_2312400 [Thermothelomyces thermophilus ATCC 42464]AEO61812.1 hypothetical protein MYCTH_2312400 [Thermothelomyces thermophilus ATCC 42464]
MPSQAPTPRATRNSRGLRGSPSPKQVSSAADSRLGDSARVARRRRSSRTPVDTDLSSALGTAVDTPTPRARFAHSPSRIRATALKAISEDQQQPATPTPTIRPTSSRPPIFPPPVSLPPATPYVPTPLPRSSSPLEHPRVTAIRSRPTRSPRRTAPPKTPARYTRYVTRFIDLTPPISPAATPQSPGSETALFKQRREQEGEDKFARELWIAIRNEHYMKGCWCGPPNIYNSKEEAEAATGHLRFYLAGSENKKLRVLQKKDDHRWHCVCGNNEYHAVYKDLLNSNGKRPAEDTEVDLLTQNQEPRGVEGSQSVERVVAAPTDPVTGAVQSRTLGAAQAKSPAPAQSMWAQTYGILSRAVAIMGSPIVALLDTLRGQFLGDAYETLDTRRTNPANDAIVVKRLKRQAPLSGTEQASSDIDGDGFDDLVWADDPTQRIGLDKLEIICAAFDTQYKIIKDDKVVRGSSIDEIRNQASDPRIYETSFSIFQYQEYLYGPLHPEASDAERAERWDVAVEGYEQGLLLFGRLVAQIYGPSLLADLRQKHSRLPRRLPVGNNEFRKDCMKLGRFLGFMRSLDCIHNTAFDQALSQMIVDANAIHKQEMPPSYVKAKQDPTETMPGCFPKESAIVEIPADEVDIEPLYDYRFPDPEPSDGEPEVPGPGVYKMVQHPKGILKPSKARDPSPPSPQYVATPKRNRKLSFISPVSKFIPPSHIPTKVMTPLEEEQFLNAKLKAEVVRDEHSTRAFEALKTVSRQPDGPLRLEDKWSLEALERDDQEMGLTYHAQHYGSFLDGLREELEKRVERDSERRAKTLARPPPRRHMVHIPLPPLPSTPERRRRAAHLLEHDSSSPAVSTPGTNPLSRLGPAEQPPKPSEKNRGPRSLEEFFAEEEDDLAISTLKLEQLQIDRQIGEELETSVQREIEEKRKRKEEEERRERERLLEEERRRKEEERRREQAARQRREADEFAALTGLRRPARPLITALSDDWDARVANAARANPTAELVKTLEGQPLTRRDFEEKLLPPTAWLNDNVIIGSILHIADYVNRAKGATDQEPKCAAFTSYFWPRVLSHGPGGCGRLLRRAGVRKANLLDIDTVLIPICAQSHWTLAVIRPGKRTVAHIDSMRGGGGDERVKAKLLELVRFILEEKFVESEWRAVDYEAPLQTNGWDCGVFTITNALCMAIGLNPKVSYTERELTLQRRRLAAVLLNEGFKGEFSLDGL